MAQVSELDQGLALLDRGNAAEAEPHFRRAAAAEPNSAIVWKALGTALAAQKAYAQAEPAFHRACQLDPKLPDACYFWGRALYGLSRFNDSVAALERADQRDWRVRLAMAQANDGTGDPASADRDFRAALELCKGRDAEPATAYGSFLLRNGRAAEAIPVLEQAVARDPNSAVARTAIGRALLESGRNAEAIPHLERAVALAPESAQAHLLLAKAYVRTGRTKEAEPHFDAARKYGVEK